MFGVQLSLFGQYPMELPLRALGGLGMNSHGKDHRPLSQRAGGKVKNYRHSRLLIVLAGRERECTDHVPVVVGPIVHQVIVVTLIAAALMIAFELLLIYKLWTATRSFARRVAVPAQAAASEDAVQQGDVGQGAEATLGV